MGKHTARNPELEAAIIATPLDPEPRMIYGDWLQAQGDPRGEWAALMAGIEAAPAETRLRSAAIAFLSAQRTAILGRGAQALVSSHLGWRGGFVDEIRVQKSARLTRAAIADLFAHPTCRFVRHVALGEPAAQMLAVLVAQKPPLLESCVVVDFDRVSELVDADALADIPTLRALSLSDAFVSRPMPQLREVIVTVKRNPSTELVAWLTGGGCPNVEELTVLQWWQRLSIPADEIAACVRAMPKLRRLRVIGAVDGDELVAAIGAVPNQIELLDVSNGTAFTDAGRSALRTWVRPPELVAHPGDGVFDLSGADVTWLARKLKTEGRDGVRMLPGVGSSLYSHGTNLVLSGSTNVLASLPYLDVAATLPAASAGTYQWANAAIAHEQAMHLDEAELRAREALVHVPAEPNFHAILIDALRRTGRLDEAAKAIPAAVKAILKPPPEPHGGGSGACLLDCLLVLAQLGRHQEAIALGKQLADEVTPECHAVLAMSHVALGKLAAAKKAMQLARPAQKPMLQHAEAVMYLIDGDTRKAKAALAKAAKANYTEMAWVAIDPNLAALRAPKPKAKAKPKPKPKPRSAKPKR